MIIFKSIKPATKFRSSTFRDEFRKAVDQMSGQVKKDFEKTVATWKEKPEFETSVKVGSAAGGKLAKQATGSASGVSLEVSTDSEIYQFVDEGTEAHIIRARNAPALAFSTASRPKTRPRVIGSRKGYRSKEIVYAKTVQHPGTEAREFTKTIAKKWTTPFRERMNKALDTAATKSGHSIK